jgi:hypothetical protein
VDSSKRSLFHELVSGVEAMREHREGRLTLRTHELAPSEAPGFTTRAGAREATVARLSFLSLHENRFD